MSKENTALLDERFLYLLSQLTDVQKQDILHVLRAWADEENRNRGDAA